MASFFIALLPSLRLFFTMMEEKDRIRNLEQKLLHKVREISLLKEMSLFFTTSLQQTLDLFSYRLGILTNAKFARLYLIDKSFTKLILVSGYNLSDRYLEMVKNRFEVSIDSVPCGKAVKERSPYIVSNVLADEIFLPWRELTMLHGYSSYLAIPLIVSGRVVGAADLFFEQVRDFPEEDINLISVLANAGALAIENALLIEKIANVSILDEDTGAFNLKHFVETLRRELDRSRRYNQPLTLIMVRIFWSDILGELQRLDRMRQFVFELRNNIRGSDMLFRYGDATFALILPQTSKAMSESVLKRLNKLFKKVFHDTAHLKHGIAGFPEDGQEEKVLIQRALGESH